MYATVTVTVMVPVTVPVTVIIMVTVAVTVSVRPVWAGSLTSSPPSNLTLTLPGGPTHYIRPS